MARFEVNGVIYESNEKGNYFYKSTGKTDKKGNPVMVRIGKPIYEKAFDEYMANARDAAKVDEWEQENEGHKHKQAEDDKQTEKNFNKKTSKKESKPRRSKDVAYEGHGVTLTAKQVKFIKRMPEDDFYEHGLDSTLWIDVYCDTVADEFNAMAVGAMVSTLREKNLIVVSAERVNGKKSKYMAFTELGREVAKDLGLN